MKSLNALQNVLAEPAYQLEVLGRDISQKKFQDSLSEINLFPLKPIGLCVFQINIGKMCNQVCSHCHVDAGPDRKEIMTQETMSKCIDILKKNPEFKTVDLTGGAPEMNPNFRWFVEQLSALNLHIIVRCNLTIIVANKKYHDLPTFFKKHKIEVVSSLPFYNKNRTDKQRGEGVFDDSIRALKMLNNAGYGIPESGLVLNLVYNPAGAFLPASQEALENDFKKALLNDFAIEFNQLYTITNLPISRYLDYLLASGNYDMYMDKLIHAFNPTAAATVMCRSTLSIGWDGYIYDCDFNQMLELRVASDSYHIDQFHTKKLANRNIVLNQHCYGCTAGSGSSCGGTTV